VYKKSITKQMIGNKFLKKVVWLKYLGIKSLCLTKHHAMETYWGVEV